MATVSLAPSRNTSTANFVALLNRLRDAYQKSMGTERLSTLTTSATNAAAIEKKTAEIPKTTNATNTTSDAATTTVPESYTVHWPEEGGGENLYEYYTSEDVAAPPPP
mmetsp:Transcript_12517/g.28449  ORF Transcript_12517/g.28449 Transcript_12517/m.28449 type:complete len:108 (-) Transcript_12517:866-1189(-)